MDISTFIPAHVVNEEDIIMFNNDADLDLDFDNRKDDNGSSEEILIESVPPIQPNTDNIDPLSALLEVGTEKEPNHLCLYQLLK